MPPSGGSPGPGGAGAGGAAGLGKSTISSAAWSSMGSSPLESPGEKLVRFSSSVVLADEVYVEEAMMGDRHTVNTFEVLDVDFRH